MLGFETLFEFFSISFRLAARRRGSISRRQEASEQTFTNISRRQEASEQAFSSVFRRREASERAFSSIFDVWRLRSELFRAFSTSGGSGARIFEVSRGEQLRPRLQSSKSANRSLRNFRIEDRLSPACPDISRTLWNCPGKSLNYHGFHGGA